MRQEASDTRLEALLSCMQDAVAAFDRDGIPYTLIGGFAVTVRGRPRYTHDVDLFVKPSDAKPALETLARTGFTTQETNPHWLYKAFREELLLDILFKTKGDIYLDDEMLERSTYEDVFGRRVRVVPGEDLIVIKALVHDEETPRHWWDALSVIAAGGLDWSYLLRRAVKGPRRVLSLLLYATSIDLVVPADAVAQLYASLSPDPIPGENP